MRLHHAETEDAQKCVDPTVDTLLTMLQNRQRDSVLPTVRKKDSCEKKYHLALHEKTAGHLANLKRDKPSTSKQSFLTTAFKDDRTNAFNVDLCEALVAANIPWTKIENPLLKQFLQKYCNHSVPSESTLRNNCLRPLHEQTLARIREELGDSSIWISVDETTDVKGRFVAHFLAGKLPAHEKTRAFLVCSKPLERTNGESVALFVNESLKVLYPTGVEATKVLLLYTDATAYMHKAAHLLKAFYPQMLHVTCLAHALHRVCEELRKHFTDVDELIGSAKAVFLKAPSHAQSSRLRPLYPGTHSRRELSLYSRNRRLRSSERSRPLFKYLRRLICCRYIAQLVLLTLPWALPHAETEIQFTYRRAA
ncbi:hypothetical protein HPB48_018910 [Haemaphysalis longicornis]|uniref:DUF659 domain-containing protein n=1 Tax=Haemaphysalis longicornis TaxID=44386 RepID=A0A9J6G321_HAELO|nr:hypothetical protein HPB48_018910 [Haemaphysalis longicornis]